ncbi:di-trans,poly-cis-decaprenylcistransferase [Patescibacteria group bacterium]|nr:di-trans,poly-cis-decaprenylcistransferase [Patescibacteria group bacterium]MBU1705479.1 di-trans,poly-cis-decaprenylcistransferase [Patescibacteria group bacterium]
MKHLAIILDGNRRWAKAQGLPTFEGHRRGYDRVKEIGLAALERGIEHLTVFAFSTENWKRSEEEVGYLMDLLLKALTKDLDFYMKHQVRLKVIGRRTGLSDKIQAAIAEAEDKTKGNTAGQINLCINYGGRAELVDAVKDIVASGVNPEQVTEELISSKIWMKDIPDPDLIIRTSGEQRTSGFLTWSGTYSEILFVEKPWPDFTVEDLDAAIDNFSNRDRRFGGNSK